jgi:signal transduction histidine kinase
MRTPTRVWRYLLLAGGWLLAVGWLGFEHSRVRDSMRRSLLDRAHDITTSLGVVIRAQRRFGTVPQTPLTEALQDLTTSSELLSLALVSPAGEIVAAGGKPVDAAASGLEPGAVHWHPGAMTVAALVELGPEQRPPFPGPPVEALDEKQTSAVIWSPEFPKPPTTAPTDGQPPPPTSLPPPAPPQQPVSPASPGNASQPAPPPPPTAGGEPPHLRPWRHSFWQTIREQHPYWMSKERFDELYRKQGLHKFVIVMSTQTVDAVISRDLWLRLALASIALMAALGVGAAWYGLEHSSGLQVRLAQARAMNTFLRELNTAAAGLAHETRNPLSIVRGLAQVVAKSGDTPVPVRQHANTIVSEVDRVTSRLNEFIDYSKPREPKLAPTSLAAVVQDVARALETDRDDKAIDFSFQGPDVAVLADESLLRQAIFNLLLNAYQAIAPGGRVQVAVGPPPGPHGAGLTQLEVRDNGPGIPAEALDQIFRPYFTLSEKGTGLGLAVVRQIVLAHHWDIAYAPNPGGGAIFRITGMRIARDGTGSEPPPPRT